MQACPLNSPPVCAASVLFAFAQIPLWSCTYTCIVVYLVYIVYFSLPQSFRQTRLRKLPDRDPVTSFGVPNRRGRRPCNLHKFQVNAFAYIVKQVGRKIIILSKTLRQKLTGESSPVHDYRNKHCKHLKNSERRVEVVT